MNVQETIELGTGHRLEFGRMNGDGSPTALRNHYPISEGPLVAGRDIPLADLGGIVSEAIRRDMLDLSTMAKLLGELASALARRATPRPDGPTIEELVARITDENRHAAIDCGPPVGNEVW